MENPQNVDNIPNEPISQFKRDQLTQLAKEYIKLETQFTEKYYKEDHDQLYLLSTNWLRQWKEFVAYDIVKNNSDTSKYLFGSAPGKINEDIFDFQFKSVFIYDFPNKNNPLDMYLKQNMALEKDFIVINKNMWELLYKANNYEGFPIIRKCYGADKKVEAHLRKINVYIIYNSYLRRIDGGAAGHLFKGKLQISNYLTLKEYMGLIQNVFEHWRDIYLANSDCVRFWKLDSSISASTFFDYIFSQCRATQGYDYKIELKGKYLGGQLEDKQFQDIEFAQEDYMIIELREQNNRWCFSNDELPREDRCENCTNVRILKVKCPCKKVAYCCQECKDKDRQYHLNRCDHPDDSDEEEKNPINQSDQSKMGVVGLKNLGNTCFMNSGIQCLSNTYELRQYFLENKYKNELNVNNPIGAKGKLAKALATAMKKMWYGNEFVISPYSVKREIGNFQSMFQGFGQHDSQEFLSYLLDGVHEDVNRVLKKPFVETKDYDESKDDQYWATESWNNFQLRNQSIIVDLMYGQYKSKLDCPDCKKISITFDPFLMISLPIPQDTKKQLDIVYHLDDDRQNFKKIKISYDKSKKPTLADFRNMISEQIEKPPQSLVFKISSTFYVEDFIFDDKVELKELKKKGKYKNIVVRSMLPSELAIPDGSRYEIQFQFTKNNSYYQNTEQYRRNISLIRPYIFNLTQTMKSIHLQIFIQYKQFYKEFLNNDLEDLENLETNVINNKDPPYRLFFVTNARNWYNCFYCGNKSCDNCPVPYNDDLLETYVNKVKTQGNRDSKIDFELYLRKDPNFGKLEEWFEKSIDEKQAEEEKKAQQMQNEKDNSNSIIDENQIDKTKIAQQLTKVQPSSTVDVKKGPNTLININIYNCIELFSKPEQLAQDNSWYCNTCKDSKQANKTMQIYKAPKILILHLKRFKSGNSVFKNKVETLVEFPIENLDISNYVINSQLPNQQQHQNQMQIQQQVLYDLYGVVNHFGSVGFGHYTAYGKNHETNKWYYFDDSCVTEELDTNKIVTNAAYVLFYRRKEQK